MISHRVFELLDVPAPLSPAPLSPALLGLVTFGLVSIQGQPVTVTTELSQDALDVAAKRGTALLAVVEHGSALESLHLSGGPWPIMVVSDSVWPLAGADLGLLVGAEGPADHDGLTEEEAAAHIKQFLDLAFDASPQPSRGRTPLSEVVPFALAAAYDVETVVEELVDAGRWMQLQAGTNASVLTGIARIEGRSVGILASRPGADGGLLGPEACVRVDRLIDWCQRSGRPLISLVDTNGLVALERMEDVVSVRDVAVHIRTSDVIKVVVVLGNAIGLGATIMGAVGARANVVLPWQRGSFALEAPAGGANDPKAPELSSTFQAACAGDVMDILDPDDTRVRIAEMLDLLRGRRTYASTRSTS